MRRSISEFRDKAALYWPAEISEEVGNASILPVLLETQDKFIAILASADRTPSSWKTALGESQSLTGALFLKHLMVLSDVAGESLDKYVPMSGYFKDNVMKFIWKEGEYGYEPKWLCVTKSADNKSLGVTGKQLMKRADGISQRIEDTCMLLMFGGLAIDDSIPETLKEKCSIGSLVGDAEGLDHYVRENYLNVSRQLQGSAANSKGAVAQDFVFSHLSRSLPGWSVSKNRSLPGVAHRSGGGGTNFDIVAIAPNNRHFAVEVSFQVTGNSTIERKSREASSVSSAARKNGHHICYVIDGAGNIRKRAPAVGIMFDNSDFTVAFSAEELALLAGWMIEAAEGPSPNA